MRTKIQTNDKGNFVGVIISLKDGKEIVESPEAFHLLYQIKPVWNEQEGRTMNINKIKCFILLSVFALTSCEKKRINYEISDTYSGPCIVFIYKNGQLENKSNKVFIENGLGRISEKKISQPFYFFSKGMRTPIEIIDIGKLQEANKNKKYIFELVYGYSSSICVKGDLHLMLFFYGYKSEYIKWSKIYHDDFWYFDSIGLDWCKYYRSGIK
jgi:hypothetical protein